MFKKSISILLIFACTLSLMGVSFANETKNSSGINEYLLEYDQQMQNEGYILVDRTIEIVKPRSKRSVIIGSGSLSSYNGYDMRYVKVNSQFNANPEVIAQGSSAKYLLNLTYNISTGFISAWLWVPSSVLGIDITEFGGTHEDMLTSQVNYIDTQYIVEIEDKDNKYSNKDFYPVSSTQSIYATNHVLWSAMNKEGKHVYARGDVSKTIVSDHYANYSWMQRMGYENYKYGNNSAFEKIVK